MLQPHERKRIEEIKFRINSDLDAKSIDVRWLLALIEFLDNKTKYDKRHIESLQEALADTESDLEAAFIESPKERS